MYRPIIIVAFAALVALAHSTGSVGAVGAPIQRLSANAQGVQANDDSSEQFISPTGRFVVFTSSADNLVPGDTNGFADVFLVDRTAGTIERVNLDSAERELNNNSEKGMVTPDGRYAVFGSYASNAIADDRNATWDVFVRDRQAGTTERVSVSSAEAETNDSSAYASISNDGRYVAFHSWAYNLVAGDDNAAADMFVRDRQAGTTERVSLSSSEAQGNGHSQNGAISRDGRYVGFFSWATNLVGADTNNTNDVFLRDRVAGTIERISVSSAGAQANGQSQLSAISADGRFIVFSSSATNLVTGDNNGTIDVFVRDRANSSVERISVPGPGLPPEMLPSQGGAISADGRYVTFWSTNTNLVTGDNNGTIDVFVRDRANSSVERISVPGPGLPPEMLPSQGGAISADGRYVTFWSTNTFLVPGDTNNKADVFLRDRQLATTSRVNVNTAGGQSVGGGSWGPVMSDDAQHIVFSSLASDLVPNDTNGVQDIFVKSFGSDSDLDGVPDESDNCPNWPNSSQALPGWPIPAGDPDCDGTGTANEASMGTNTTKQCPATSTPGDESVDAWPPDLNDSGLVDLGDIILVGPKFNQATGTDPELMRFDLNMDRFVSLQDVVMMGPYFNEYCS